MGDRFVWNEVVGRRLRVFLMARILGSVLGTNIVHVSHFSHVYFVHCMLCNNEY